MAKPRPDTDTSVTHLLNGPRGLSEFSVFVSDRKWEGALRGHAQAGREHLSPTSVCVTIQVALSG